MISLPRVFLSLFLYGAYIFAIIAIADPRQNTALYLILLALGSVVFLAGMFSSFFIVSGKYRRIKAHGVEAEATILSVSDTGVTLNKNPYVNCACAWSRSVCPLTKPKRKPWSHVWRFRAPATACA